MAKEEIQQNWEDFRKAKAKEIDGLFELGCFQRFPCKTSHNTIDARWVITWKMIEGNVGVKCRFGARGVCESFLLSCPLAFAPRAPQGSAGLPQELVRFPFCFLDVMAPVSPRGPQGSLGLPHRCVYFSIHFFYGFSARRVPRDPRGSRGCRQDMDPAWHPPSLLAAVEQVDRPLLASSLYLSSPSPSSSLSGVFVFLSMCPCVCVCMCVCIRIRMWLRAHVCPQFRLQAHPRLLT